MRPAAIRSHRWIKLNTRYSHWKRRFREGVGIQAQLAVFIIAKSINISILRYCDRMALTTTDIAHVCQCWNCSQSVTKRAFK